jgi:hypothetical protein
VFDRSGAVAARGVGLALERFGYTPRQAHFLTLVALHGGYFLRRQYVRFAGGRHGLATTRFLAKARAQSHIRKQPYGRHGSVFHLCARPMYAALDQENNRNRRRADWFPVLRKIMTLDFVLTRPTAQFWATEDDKAALLRELGVDQRVWPAKRYLSRRDPNKITARHFVDKMPWYREPDDPHVWFAYINAESTFGGFDSFLREYAGVIAAVTSGVVFVGVGPCRTRVEAWFARTHGRELQQAFSLPAFLDYCRLRRAIDAGNWHQVSVADIQRFRELRTRFAAPSFDVLFRRWEQDGESAIRASEVRPALGPLRVHELAFRYEPDLSTICRV